MLPILIKEGVAVLLVGAMLVVGNFKADTKPLPKDKLGEWLDEKEAVEIFNKYGNVPVVVKGGRDRDIFPLEEVIKNGNEFEEVHPNIGWIREIWIPSEDNLKIMKKTHKDSYEWFNKHLEKSWWNRLS